MSNTKKNFYLPTLDGWRAISILLVLVYHFSWFYLGPEVTNHDPALWHYFKLGTYGVCLFFTISGFLVTLRIFEEIKENGFFDWKKFMLRRVFRILPPFYLFLFILLILSTLGLVNFSTTDLISSLTFTRIYFTENVGWYTAHVWSLCVEEHFYILLTCIFIFMKRSRFTILFLVIFLIVVLWNILSFKLQDNLQVKTISDQLKVFSWMSYMFAGSLLAAIATFHKNFLDYLQKFKIGFLILLPVLIGAQYPLKLLFLPAFCAITIAMTCLYPNRFILGFLENKLMIFIGKISYSLYIWQQLFFVPSHQLSNQLGGLQIFPYNIIIVFILAICSHNLIEKPIIDFGRKVIK
jgi:peptidoglycan/LPS O-acetylase OafA/YrhL